MRSCVRLVLGRLLLCLALRALGGLGGETRRVRLCARHCGQVLGLGLGARLVLGGLGGSRLGGSVASGGRRRSRGCLLRLVLGIDGVDAQRQHTAVGVAVFERDRVRLGRKL